MSSNEAPIIIKRIKKGGHGHHGGAWKVAYADFVTAMMAFFLMLWLINTTTPEQKRGIADYFAPASLSQSKSGAGGIMGGTSFSTDGSRSSGSASVVSTSSRPNPPGRKQSSDNDKKSKNSNGAEAAAANDSSPNDEIGEDQLKRALAQREERLFEQAEQSLRQAMSDLPELAELSKNLIIDQTPEGLRIQIVDQQGRPMFPPGRAKPYKRTATLIAAVAKVINRLPNRISISGHTDSKPFVRADGYSNWDLSADRANASLRILASNQVSNDRIYQVSGKAGSEPLFPDDPYIVGNRRISIVLLREAPVLPPSLRR
jgi:chemotaxis protein MotB